MSERAHNRAAWDPSHYLRFADDRSRPFLDLVDEYEAALRDAYPHTPHGTACRFERVFAVARQAS